MVLTEDTPPSAPLPRRVWSFWPTIGFSTVILIAYNALQLLVILAVFVIQICTSEIGLQEALGQLATNGLAFSLAIIVSVPLGLLLVLLFIRLKKDLSVADYLGFKPLRVKTALLSALIFLVILAVVLMVENYLGESGDANFSTELYRNSGFLPGLWLAVVFLAPLFEEVFFRGFLFVGLRSSRLGTVAAIVLTSLLWAAMHLQYNLYGIAQILGIGLILGIVRHKTDSLWSPLIIHILWNGAAMIFTALYISSGG